MAIAFIAIAVLLRADPARSATRSPLSRPDPGARATPPLAVLAIAALFYNIGFFVLLAYTPFPLGFDALGIGLTFFGWGVALAITSVWVAPFSRARMPRTTRPAGSSCRCSRSTSSPQASSSRVPPALVACIIVGGLLLGVLNTVLTESVMEATDLPRSVASSAYSAVRFLGGAAAPPIAALLWHLVRPDSAVRVRRGIRRRRCRSDRVRPSLARESGRARSGCRRRGRCRVRRRRGLKLRHRPQVRGAATTTTLSS